MKKLIKQYVNTGIKLPEYQMSKLSNNDLKSYFRRRLQQTGLSDYELYKLNEIDRDALRKHISSCGDYKAESELV